MNCPHTSSEQLLTSQRKPSGRKDGSTQVAEAEMPTRGRARSLLVPCGGSVPEPAPAPSLCALPPIIPHCPAQEAVLTPYQT